MAKAYKCDVKDCEDITVGEDPAGTVEITTKEGGFVDKHMCRRHTDALADSYFPEPKPEVPPAPATATGTPPATT